MLPAVQVEGQAVVPGEILRLARNAVAFEVLGRTADDAPIRIQGYRHLARVGRTANADGHVVAVVDQIHEPVGEIEGHGQFRMPQPERDRMGRHVQAPERCGRRNRQAAHQRMALGHDAGIGGRQILHQLPALLEVGPADVRQREPARRAMHELHAKAFLECGQAPPHHGGRYAFDQRRRREAAFLRGQYEALDFGIAVHGRLPQGRVAILT